MATRAAAINPANRFLAQRTERDADGDGFDLPEDDLPVQTQFLEVRAKTIVNKVTSPDVGMAWSVNGYQGCEHGCAYCYARPTHEYYGYSAGTDFESKIQVKINAPALLEEAITRPTWEGDPISISGNTDCYQPAERRYRLTRQMLEICLRHGQPVGLITKNALIRRDVDLLSALAKEGLVHVYFSITSLSEELRRKLEPRTATAAQKLASIKLLTEAGVPCGIMNAPLIPGLNDHETPAIIEAAATAGALAAGYTYVRLNGAIGPVFTEWVHRAYPDRAEKILRQIAHGHGGKINDSQFGRRMSGEGAWAEAIGKVFRLARERHMAGRSMPPYNRATFRKGGQLRLF